MHNLAPATFLKLMSQLTEQKIRDLEQYDRPDGYDAHRLMRLAIRRGLSGGNLAGVHPALLAISVEAERARALQLEPQLLQKLRAEGTVYLEPPRELWRSPRLQFGIDFHPDAAVQQGNHRLFAFLYFHSTVRPSPTSAGALILLARRALAAHLGEADEVAVIDVKGQRTFRATFRTSASVLEKEVADLDTWFADRSR